MSDAVPDNLDAVARYLSSRGDDGAATGLSAGERGVLDRMRSLLADEAMWVRPSAALLDAVVADTAPAPARLRDRTRRAHRDLAAGPERLPGGGRVARLTPLRHPDHAARPGRTSAPDHLARPGSHGRRRRRALVGLAGGVAASAALVVGLAATDWSRPPAGETAALAGTTLAPDASATATLRDTPAGIAITLQVTGLAPAPAGSYYQAWVVGSRGSVAVGTFHLRGHDEEVPVELWSGVELADYPRLTVTLEPEDGDPGTSHRTVLAGSVR